MTLNLESFFLLRFIYNPVKDFFLWIKKRRKPRFSNSEVVQLRLKWKKIFSERFLDIKIKKLGYDVIVRDVSRLNEYPDSAIKSKGISPWFKAGLAGTYDKGIILCIGWEKVYYDEIKKVPYLIDYKNRKKSTAPHQTLMIAGYVPYERIESVDWSGDDYYSNSQLYLHFDGPKNMPYDEIAYCEENELDGFKYYTKIVSQNKILMRKK